MLIRPVSPENLGNFIEAAGPPEHYEEVDHCLRHMFSAGSMRPEWCFMAEEGDYAAVGRRLLSHALDAARALGAEDIEHVIDAPPMRPQFQHHARKWIDLLKSTGFYLRRETGRYEWSGTEPPTETGRLSFHPLEEVGKEEFIAAMERISGGTLDREIRAERERPGTKHSML